MECFGDVEDSAVASVLLSCFKVSEVVEVVVALQQLVSLELVFLQELEVVREEEVIELVLFLDLHQ